jgi:hypothetical protein
MDRFLIHRFLENQKRPKEEVKISKKYPLPPRRLVSSSLALVGARASPHTIPLVTDMPNIAT